MADAFKCDLCGRLFDGRPRSPCFKFVVGKTSAPEATQSTVINIVKSEKATISNNDHEESFEICEKCREKAERSLVACFGDTFLKGYVDPKPKGLFDGKPSGQ